MKRTILFILFILPQILFAQINYHDHFKDASLRFDFLLGGNHNSVELFPAQIKKEKHWAGPKKNLIDPFAYGSYCFKVYDLDSNQLIFSKGFSTLFQEWQTTAEAKEQKKTFYQAVIFPFPKNKVRLEIAARNRTGDFESIFETQIDPENYFIIDETMFRYKKEEILKNGSAHAHVDLLILAEGYTKEEEGKFFEDAKRVTNYLFSAEPFHSEKKHFNVTALHSVSLESGTDVPGEHVYKNTRFNSSFYTFDLPRYLTTADMKSVLDVAGTVPYDHIYVLVNTDRYGGGGFYNFLSVCTSDNERTPQVFTHEFGHGFTGLGDEYYTSNVAYEDFYNLEIEPWEPNLTTRVDFDSKWKNMIAPTTPVPTPREAKNASVIGAYEGGGYLNKGIYSPYIDCRMKSNEAKDFCPVCVEAIRRTIRFYSDKQ